MRIDARFLAHMCAAVVLAFFGSLSALAQDYTVTSQSGQWTTPPASATDILPNIANKDDGIYTITSLPFAIPYFGVNVTSVSVCTNGYCFMNASGAHATAYSPTSYPYPQTTTGTSGRDGLIAVAWQDLHGSSATAQIRTWSDGTYPNRRFIVAWLNWQHFSATGSMPGFQVQFYESGRIQVAYLNASSWIGSSGTAWNYATGVGIDALTPDTRWVTPNGSSTYTFTSNPPNDFRFEPKITTFTGTVLMDRYLVDAGGIGATKLLGQPASGLTVELRDATNKAVGTAVTDVNGSFNLKGVALVGTAVGSIWITGQTPICAVRAVTGGTSVGVQLASNVPFNADKDVGTTTITESNDPGGVLRAALNIASTVQGTYDWCASRTLKPIPFLEILYDTSSSPTSYSKPGATPAQMRISGATSNPDGWDRSVIRRTYARHVLGSVSGFPSGSFDNTYDAVTNDENAFAEGFGYYLHFAVSGESSPFYDGISSSLSNATNVEEPTTQLQSPKGSNVAAWNALALYDLTDPANEPWDFIDGTGSAVDRPFLTVATLAAAPTSTTFFTQWATRGFNAAGLSTSFIRHGMLADDADEPNDTSTTPKALTQFGFIRSARVLNMFNEDWYSFIMPQPTNKLQVNLTFDRTLFNTQIVCELYDAAGARVATATAATPTSAFQAVTGALAAGTFRIRVKHTGGARLPAYEVSAFSELAFSAADLAPWTVGRPISLPVNIKGGIPPYTLSVEPADTKPPGLILDGVNARVSGVPSQAGYFEFILAAGDSANPKNSAAGAQSFRVNPPLEFAFGEFVALPHDRDLALKGAYTGGTAPYTTSVSSGELPPGCSFAENEIRFVGRTTAQGSFRAELRGIDVAGSEAIAPVTAVVCMPAGESSTLAGGHSACGFYFDGVAGSTAKLSVRTVAKKPRRELSVVVLASDGTTLLETKARGGKGKASLPTFVLPSTGRFYVVVSSDVGDATELVSSGKVVANRGGRGENPDQNFVAGDIFKLKFGALAGAKLTFTAKPHRGTGLNLKPIYYLIDPNGEISELDEDTDVSTSRGSVTYTKTLDISGTWQVLVGAESGPQGSFSYSYKLLEPKGGAFQAD